MNRFGQIGNTPLIPLKELGGEPLTAEVLIKDESVNPTGTHKDRKSAWLIQQALENDVDTLAILTAGNAGFSLATLAQETHLEVVTIISNSMRPDMRDSLEGAGARTVEVDFSRPLNSVDITNLARTSKGQRIWDVTNEGHDAYKQIYQEIHSENADLVLCPMGSGELFIGLVDGITENHSNSVVYTAHPITTPSIADKLCTEYLPLKHEILDAQMQQIVNRMSYSSHGRGFISEDEIQWCVENAPQFLQAEPSALVPLHMIYRLRNQQLKMIMINTGKGKVEDR